MRRVAPALAVSVSILCWAATAAAQTPEQVVVTQQDLIDMTEAGLPVSLIVKTVKTAAEAPVLQPQDLVSLRNLGVDPAVLEAVVERAGSSPPPVRPSAKKQAAPAEPVIAAAAAYGARKVSVTATLESKRGWRIPFASAESGGLAVYWAVSLVGDGAEIAECPREPICWCADAIGQKTCSQPDEALWRKWLSCHRVVEMAPGTGATVFDFEITGATPEEIRLLPLVMAREKNGSMRLEPWASSVFGPAYIAIEPHEARTFDAEIQVLLEEAGSKTDLRLPTTRFDEGQSTRPRGDLIRIRPASGVDMLPESPCNP